METPSSQEPQQPLPGPSVVLQGDTEENKDLAAISYVWVLAVVIFFTKRESPFVYFHVKQALVLFALSLVAGFFGWFGKLLLLVILALSVLGFLNAAQGLKKDLPVIGAIARADIPALKHSLHDLWHSFLNLFHSKKKPPTPPTAPTPTVTPSAPESTPPVPPTPSAQ